MNDKAAVEAARADYDALSDADKAFVDPALLQKLTDVETALANLEAAKTVENQINALPDVIIYDDKADVEAARQAYDALTDAQKALVDPDALQKLTDAEQSIAVREPAKAVEALIFDLPDADKITLDDKADVEAARAALDALTPEQAEYVTFIALDKLFRAEDAIAAAEVTAMIDALPAADDVTVNDETDIINARAAYDALSDAQKVLIESDTLQKLTDDEAAINSFVLLGDADGDGDISILDATFIQRYLADFDLTVPFNENAADVDGDDDISILDAAFIQRFLVDMDVDYPINQYVKR